MKSLTKRENSKPYIKKRVENRNSTISANSGRNTLNNDDDNNEILKETESKVIDYIINEEEPKIKNLHIVKKIFIPEYVIEDQIITREVITDNNKDSII